MRLNNRQNESLRSTEILTGVNEYAEGSCLIKSGSTHVLCTASVEDKVPAWLKGQDKGWITAEYALLPRSTRCRVARETKGQSGRTYEIQRLIGRALRAVTDLNVLNGYVVIMDCDVLQADGGTRTAAITGSFVALYQALQKMVVKGQIPYVPIKEFVAAISCGLKGDIALLDLDYEEDSTARADMNFVLTESGKIVEIQGTAEGEPYEEKQFERMFELAKGGVNQLIDLQKKALGVKNENS